MENDDDNNVNLNSLYQIQNKKDFFKWSVIHKFLRQIQR
jgi:hypothetical protein